MLREQVLIPLLHAPGVHDTDQVAGIRRPALQQTLYLGGKVPPRGSELGVLHLQPSHAHLQAVSVSVRVQGIAVCVLQTAGGLVQLLERALQLRLLTRERRRLGGDLAVNTVQNEEELLVLVLEGVEVVLG